MFFHLHKKGAIKESSDLSDWNEELVTVYNEIKEIEGRNPSLIDQLRSLEGKFTRDEFDGFRKEFNVLKKKSDPTIEEKTRKASLLVYLNKTCFNGLYRENSKGEFNVPYGRYENPNILDEANIRAVSVALRSGNTTIKRRDFQESSELAQPLDFVYFDPPYLPISETASFTSYTHSEKGNFDFSQQMRLAGVFEKLAGNGVFVLLSNSHHEEIRKLYQGVKDRLEEAKAPCVVNIETVSAARYISCKGDGRKPVLEYAIQAVPIQD